MSITQTSYPNLFGPTADFAVLAQVGITFGANNAINNGGLYGSSNGTYTGAPSPGTQGTAGQIIAGTTELGVVASLPGRLVKDVIDVANGFSAPNQISLGTTVTTNTTILPGKNYFSASALTFTGPLTVTFDAGGDPNAQFFITAETAINFTGANISLINSALPINIFILAKSEGITFDATSTAISGNIISYAAISFAGPSTINGRMFAFGPAGAVTFVANTTINPSLVCYLKGTKILTETGYVAIEHLKVGDKVATKGKIYDNAYINEEDEFSCEPITWIGNFRAPNLNEQSFPICITAHAFGENAPFENLYVSPGHRVLIDGKMVLPESLVNGTTIYQDCNRIEIEYYHLELESHSAIVANGVLSESYLDFENHVIFENKPVGGVVMPLQLTEAITA